MRWIPLLVAALVGGCRKGPPAGPAAAGSPGLTFVDGAPRPVLVVAEAPEGSPPLFAAGSGTLVLAAGPAVAAATSVRRAGPPGELLDAVRGSLTPEAQVAAPPAARLPMYDAQIRVDPASGHLAGGVAVFYPNTTGAPLANLPLRLFANALGPLLTVSNVLAEGRIAQLVRGSDPTLAVVSLDPPLPDGEWLALRYHLSGEVPVSEAQAAGSLAGALIAAPAHAPDYGLFARFPGGIALADWLPMVAGRIDGHFDQGPTAPIGDTAFADLSSFRIAVDLPSGYTLAAPGVLLGEELLPDRYRRTRIALADARDVTLFASKRFREGQAHEGALSVRVFYEEGHGAQAQAVLTAERRAVAGLSERLVPYPWTQITAVEVPLGGGAGGAEFSGLIALASLFFDVKPSIGPGLALTGSFFADLRDFTVTHEVAHEWWAIQIASHPRLEPDVDEPLAQATAAMFLSPSGGKKDRREIFDDQVAINYQGMRMLGSEDQPVARSTADFQSTAEYAGLVYGKAPFFYEALAAQVGDELFWRGLAAYAAAYRFGLARRGDVVRVFAGAQLDRSDRLQAAFSHWFLEAHGDEDLAGRGEPLKLAAKLFPAQEAASDEDGPGFDSQSLLKAAQQALEAAATAKPGKDAPQGPGAVDTEQAQRLLKQLQSTYGGLDTPEEQ